MSAIRSEVPKEMQTNIDFYTALSYVFEFYDGNTGALDTAISKLSAFITAHPEHALVPLARYNQADAYAMQQKFKEALQIYISLYRNPQSSVDRVEVLKKVVLIYAATQEWQAGIPYFTDNMRMAENDVDRTTSAAYLMIAQAKQGDVADSRKMLEFFRRPSPVFYTPRFNAALMEVGDQLKKEGDLATASLFYQFVRTYERLEIGLAAQVNYLEARVAKYAENSALRNFYVTAKAELDNAKADLAAVKSSENYTPLLKWRIASVYMDMGRKWEAFWCFQEMVDRYPNHKYAEDILFSAYSLAYQLGDQEIAESLGKRYLDQEGFKRFRSTVAEQTSKAYLEQERYEELYQLTAWYLERSADDQAARLLLFKHGVARMTRMENRQLIDDFEHFRQQFGESHSGPVIYYFLGLSYLIEQENKKSLDRLNTVLASRDPQLTPDAAFRKAQATLALDRVPEARDLVTTFIANYPSHPLRASAELTLGNIVDLFGDADQALVHYKRVAEHTEDRSLLAQAELKISRILIAQTRADEAIADLSTFITKYAADPESIAVSAALAKVYKDRDQPREALLTLKQVTDRFYKLTEVDQIDPILAEYLLSDRKLRVMRQATEDFLAMVASSPEKLRDLVTDRAKQYRFFEANEAIDVRVRDRFVGDDDFRQAVLQDVGELKELEAFIAKLNESIPAVSADDWMQAALQAAYLEDDIALIVRLKAAFAHAQQPVDVPPSDMLKLVDVPESWAKIGAMGKLWILTEMAKTQAERVLGILQDLSYDYVNTDNELELHQLLAACYQRLDQVDLAIEAYQMVIKRFTQLDAAGEAAFEIGRLETQRGNYAASREILETILQRNEWRGQMHARALLEIGRAYAAEGKLSEAHGFFERIILAYPGFKEELAMGFYEDIQVLQQMNDRESVQMVYDAFVLTPGLEGTQGAALIRKEFE
ncbi:tetratricopeptide repeat protein [Coraliomargarita sp. SDUM461003]|uniref:Tetratricopeptide repeat protein n=1 Tax=Thalassobacterium maritimum TaxID=3041265 RepID=A0ABU1AQD0_9BACT|nr:tetratricopeptide repeat protein [Coraliomargarita sp. SDUM461003]MDQ8206356.1 tetratricopeptide repeat protein [Coraliomargarita sp. SDUM461003]